MKAARSGRIVNVASQAGLWSGRNGDRDAVQGGEGRGCTLYPRPGGGNGTIRRECQLHCAGLHRIVTNRAQLAALPARELTDQIALRRVGQPEEAAKVVEFLVTDLSDYVTGQCIPVCGGYVAW